MSVGTNVEASGPAGTPDTPTEVEPRVGGPQLGRPLDEKAKARLLRGEAVIRRHETRWRELWAHFDGDQFVERTASDDLVRIETREGKGKPRWRSRLIRNRFTKAIVGEVSVIASRFPTWEVAPLNADQETRNKARLGEKALTALGQKLRIRQHVFRVVQVAGVTGDGYTLPLWDPTIGDPILDELGKPTGKRTGDIKLKVLRQDQCMWQPHTDFYDSRWYGVRDAQPLEDVKEQCLAEGLSKAWCDDHLTADATTASTQYREGDSRNDLVFVYHYFERPSSLYPSGRYLKVANSHVVCKPYEYPLDADIPCIHRFAWIYRENRERGLGAGELAIDIQRAITRIVNQLVAWRNLVLNPQLLAPEGSMKSVATEEPGVVLEYRPTAGQVPKWREAPDIPTSLFQDLQQAYADLDYVVGTGGNVPAGVDSGAGIQAVNEREQSYRAQIIANLAAYYSSLGEHLIQLMRQHYTEQRLIAVNGRFGVHMVRDFLGSDLPEFAGVTVNEGSITPRTRAEQEAKIIAFADKGWISPAQAMATLQGGTAEAILDRFELDIAKAHRHIAALIEIGNGELDPDLVPFAGPMDDHAVQADVLSQWMKTDDYEKQHDLVKVMAMALLRQHQAMQQVALDEEQARLQMQSVANGQQAATRPASPDGVASGASLATTAEAIGGNGAPPSPTQPAAAGVNQPSAVPTPA